MKFKDLEIGQTFRHGAGTLVCIKTGSGGYKGVGEPDKHIVYVNKPGRDLSVAPEGEPPSSIETARRDARWWLLTDMDKNVATDLSREGKNVREIHRQNLKYGLDVLRAEMITNPENRDQVLHDLIEIVRELV